MTVTIIDMTHCDSVVRLTDTVPTLQARMETGGNQVPMVAFGLHPFITNANADKPHHGPDGDGFIREQSFALATMGRPKVAAEGVRRLTPVECERLQGMPDNWTRIPYRGKPAEECPDSPRYKAIGNSWAVPVIHWIGKRIDAAVKAAEQEEDWI